MATGPPATSPSKPRSWRSTQKSRRRSWRKDSRARAWGRDRSTLAADAAENSPRQPVGRRLFLGLLAAGASAIVVGGRLVDAPQAYHDVSTMPTNLEQPPGPLANPVFRGPERFRYYSVAPVPRFSRATWRLTVGGLVDRPFTLNYGELYSTPSVFVRADFRCVTGWVVHNVLWRGIQLRSLFDKAGVQPGAKFV